MKKIKVKTSYTMDYPPITPVDNYNTIQQEGVISEDIRNSVAVHIELTVTCDNNVATQIISDPLIEILTIEDIGD